MGRETSGDKLCSESFDRIAIRDSFYFPYFLFAYLILNVEIFRGNFPGKIFSVFGFMGNIFHRRGITVVIGKQFEI